MCQTNRTQAQTVPQDVWTSARAACLEKAKQNVECLLELDDPEGLFGTFDGIVSRLEVDPLLYASDKDRDSALSLLRILRDRLGWDLVKMELATYKAFAEATECRALNAPKS